MGKKSVVLLNVLLLLSLLGGCGSGSTASVPKLSKLPEYRLLTLRQKGPYDKQPQAFGTLFAQMGKLGVKPAGVPFVIFYNDPAKAKPADYDWEVCVPVSREVKPQAPVKYRIQPPTEAVALLYTGDYGTKEHTACYATLMAYLGKMTGYRMSGPPVEVYLEIKGMNGGKKNRTQIYFPVKKQ